MPLPPAPALGLLCLFYAETGKGTMSPFVAATGVKLTRCAWAMLYSHLRCPYVFICQVFSLCRKRVSALEYTV